MCKKEVIQRLRTDMKTMGGEPRRRRRLAKVSLKNVGKMLKEPQKVQEVAKGPGKIIRNLKTNLKRLKEP